MADTDVLTRLDKQMEGNSLALSAVAEVLQKMEYRMLRDEETVSKQMEEESEATEREALIKAIAGEVVSVIKQGGLDVDGKKTRPAAKTPAYTADTEKPVSPASKIEDQQATIQAMLKNVPDDDEEKYPKAEKTQHKAADADDEEDEEPKKGYAMKGADEEDEDGENSERAPIKNAEDDDDDDEEKGYNKAMAKELDALRKQIAAYEAGMQKAVQDETETRLRKMGFKQETSLQRPLQIEGPAPSGLGIDGTTRLKKGGNSPEDTAEQLMQLSYKDLRELQARIEMGQTDGVPAELLGNS
jgi:vacuolar-type H+-ATPase subunit I/STV1